MQTLTDAQLTRRFALLQAVFFAGYSGCAFLSFLLLQKAMPTALIGVMSAVVSLASTLVQPLWGVLCDRRGCHRGFYVLGAVLCPVIYYTISRTQRIWLLFVCAALSGCFVNCLQNMANGWVAGLNSRGRKVEYSAARGCGSMMYALAAILYGRAVLVFGNGAIPALMVAFGVGVIVVSARIPRVECIAGAREKVNLREGLSILLRQRDYVIFVLCAFLAMFSLAGTGTYFAVFLDELGANSQHVGLGNFVMAMAEALAMFLFSRVVRRVPFRGLFTLCLLAHALECILLALSPNYVCAILSMAVQCLSFGLLVPCIQHFTFRHVERRYASTAQLFSTSVGLSASLVFGDLFSGLLSGLMPLRAMFLWLSVPALLGTAIYGITTHNKKPV